MSFSRSLSGKAATAALLLTLAAEQKATDEGYNASEGVVEGHQKQISAIVTELAPVVNALPDSASVSGTLWGHANNDQSGTYGYSLSVSLSGGGSTPAVHALPDHSA